VMCFCKFRITQWSSEMKNALIIFWVGIQPLQTPPSMLSQVYEGAELVRPLAGAPSEGNPASA
jgi:hypothetical protein